MQKNQDKFAHLISELRDPEHKMLFREALARAMHAEHCKTKTIYFRERYEIDTAWAADGKNRRLWIESASVIFDELQHYLLTEME